MHREKAFYGYLLEYFRDKPVKAYLLGERDDVVYGEVLRLDALAFSDAAQVGAAAWATAP